MMRQGYRTLACFWTGRNSVWRLLNFRMSWTHTNIRKCARKLSHYMQEQWNRKATYISEVEQKTPAFEDFLKFVNLEQKVSGNPTFSKQSMYEHSGCPRPQYSTGPMVKTGVTRTDVKKQCEHCGMKNHEVDSSSKFRKFSQYDRKSFVKAQPLCFRCLNVVMWRKTVESLFSAHFVNVITQHFYMKREVEQWSLQVTTLVKWPVYTKKEADLLSLSEENFKSQEQCEGWRKHCTLAKGTKVCCECERLRNRLRERQLCRTELRFGPCCLWANRTGCNLLLFPRPFVEREFYRWRLPRNSKQTSSHYRTCTDDHYDWIVTAFFGWKNSDYVANKEWNIDKYMCCVSLVQCGCV